jgi:signal transduction histidine kinase
MVDEEMTNEQLKEQLILLRNQLENTLDKYEEQKLILKLSEQALLKSDEMLKCAEDALAQSENRRISEHSCSEEALRLSNELYKHSNQALILSEKRRIKNKEHDENSLRLSDELRKQAEEALKTTKSLLQEANDKIANLNKKMLRLDQLDLVGQLAAGIGHEIRNPMTTVKGFLQLYRDKEAFLQYKDSFDLMIDELDRANSIISEFLSLARNKAVELKIMSLNKIIKSILPLIEADGLVADKYIKLETKKIPELLLDEKEIRQLTLNLVRNGLEAIPPGGNLIIRTYSEDGEVVLAVQDSGKGIPPEVLEKIGTPFFTTKDTGTGLGLAVCYSIAARHNARIDVETGANGTTFFTRFKEPGTKSLTAQA